MYLLAARKHRTHDLIIASYCFVCLAAPTPCSFISLVLFVAFSEKSMETRSGIFIVLKWFWKKQVLNKHYRCQEKQLGLVESSNSWKNIKPKMERKKLWLSEPDIVLVMSLWSFRELLATSLHQIVTLC